MSFQKRIDVHSHFIPPFYRTACEEAGHSKPDGMPAIPQWTEKAHLDLMESLSITKSILSISSPGTHLIPGDSASAKKLSRDCNEYAADLARRRPQEFGFWASLPVPDVSATLDEISYALDTLHADGFTLHTNHHGLYLGDPAFDAIFDELNRRKAKLFIHPTTPCIPSCNGAAPQSAATLAQFPNPMFEFFFDTARCVINLFLSGTIARCPNITFIIPHAGGALPPTVERFSSFATEILGLDFELNSKIIKETFMKQFYFDLAGFPFPDQIYGLLRFVDSSRLLYGSDFPFTPARGVLGLAGKMKVGMEEAFGEEEQKMILLWNAERLLGLDVSVKL